MRVLVTGGAGYVGSISVEHLLAQGHEVTILDALATGHRAAVPPEAEFVPGSVRDGRALVALLRDRGIDAVLHCAARTQVPESVREPALYYGENVVGGFGLLDAMREAGVDRLVFSSSAAVYGAPESVPIDESAPLRPISPYGETKRVFESALAAYGQAYGLRSVALRYFNAAGATERYGEDHRPESHLIPNVLKAILGGEPVTVMGTDYPTPDGSCIRDYIHVSDLAAAHIAALELTGRSQPGLEVCNLGSGSGFSVLEVLRVAGEMAGREVPHRLGPRRSGDPPVLIATNVRARELLGWTPARGSLEEIVGSAWRWRQAHPDGYESVPVTQRAGT